MCRPFLFLTVVARSWSIAQPIVLAGADEQQLQVVAELVEVLTNEA